MDSPTRATTLVHLLSAWFPFKIDPQAVTTEELALCGVARMVRLLDGMVQVHESPELGGAFARPLFETWMTTAYVLLGGPEAYARTEASDFHEQARMCRRFLALAESDNELARRPSDDPFLEQCRELLALEKPTASPINLWDMANDVQDLLSAIEDPNSGWPTAMYANLFATESYLSTHGGLGAIKQHVLQDGAVSDEISTTSAVRDRRDHRLDLMTAALMALARKVGVSLRLDVSTLDRFAHEAFPQPNP